jgi:hypothetical protein
METTENQKLLGEAAQEVGEKIAKSKAFIKSFNDPVWDWSTQRWKGSIIRDDGCNYYDFSSLRPNLLDALKVFILAGLKGDLSPLKEVINAINSDLVLQCGDLIQIGKTKNRGLYVVSVSRVLPITQLLGGNGFGEIPLTFLFDINQHSESSLNSKFRYNVNHWSFKNHPIINHVPYVKQEDDMSGICNNIRISGKTFTITEGSSLNHPYVYLDFDNNEYFTLPATVKGRFETEIERILNKFEISLASPNTTTGDD